MCTPLFITSVSPMLARSAGQLHLQPHPGSPAAGRGAGDGIGDMPLLLQVKLLQFLEAGEVWPVGASNRSGLTSG